MRNTIQSIHPLKPQSGQRQIDETSCSATRVDQLLEECEINGLIMNLGSHGQHSYGYSLTDKAYRILETEEDPKKFTLIKKAIKQGLVIYRKNKKKPENFLRLLDYILSQLILRLINFPFFQDFP